MKFSLNFVKEFIDLKESPQKVANLLTMAGLEVEHIYREGHDWILETEVTSNRPDWLSIVGIAYELSALLRRKLKVKIPRLITKPLLKEIDIIIEDKEGCPIYLARLIKGVKVEDSPSWLKHKIVACGINPVNNIVDITNYCMIKWGNPLHAFDFDKIEGNVYVRRAKKEEKFTGLDEKERILTEENLVISDERKIIALAGIIGGKNTEVDQNTKNILLEGAIFSPVRIRRSRRAMGIETESSYRFERRVSWERLKIASQEAVNLILSLGGGKLYGCIEKGRRPQKKTRRIVISLPHLENYLGERIPKQEVKTILTYLGFQVEKVYKEKLCLKPPSLRMDVSYPVDVYEEVARIYGYDRIKPTLPFIPKQIYSSFYQFKKVLRDFLISLGIKEIITYSITSQSLLEELKEKNFIKISNPLRQQENVLRPTLLCGGIEAVKHNLNQKAFSLKFFEIANIYFKEEKSYKEKANLAIAFSGERNQAFYLKGVVREVLRFANIKDYSWVPTEKANFTNALDIVKDSQSLGFLGKIDSRLKEKFDLTEDLYFAQIDLEKLWEKREPRYFSPFSRFPVVFRDISIALKEVKFSQLEEIIKKEAGNYFKGVEVIDIYQGKKIPPQIFALTLRVYYQAQDRTLTSLEVDAMHDRIRKILGEIEGVILR
ncbi:MAG TPA: phenylalanine--tRNA ligase subunit beta [Candidatus Omnitrophica bacterium]|nr:phenylalanine--tRNA ligase subunit beta [Candidatus Omnitrophota bacterium]